MKKTACVLVFLFAALSCSKLTPPAPTPSPTPKAVDLWPKDAWTGAEPVYVLALGSDIGAPRYGRGGDMARGRADSIHIIAIDPNTLAGTVYGIPRDSYVDIPGHGRDKINAAMSSGGPDLMVETMKQFTGLPINYYALVSFDKFEDVVNDAGGIDVDVPYDMQDLRYSGANFTKGMRHMNGKEALAFSRNRHGAPNGDFSRSENQGRVIMALFTKGKELSKTPVGFVKALKIAQTHVNLNIGWRGINSAYALANLARRSNPANFKNVVMPGSGGWAGRASVVYATDQAYADFKDLSSDAVLNGQ